MLGGSSNGRRVGWAGKEVNKVRRKRSKLAKRRTRGDRDRKMSGMRWVSGLSMDSDANLEHIVCEGVHDRVSRLRLRQDMLSHPTLVLDPCCPPATGPVISLRYGRRGCLVRRSSCESLLGSTARDLGFVLDDGLAATPPMDCLLGRSAYAFGVAFLVVSSCLFFHDPPLAPWTRPPSQRRSLSRRPCRPRFGWGRPWSTRW